MLYIVEVYAGDQLIEKTIVDNPIGQVVAEQWPTSKGYSVAIRRAVAADVGA